MGNKLIKQKIDSLIFTDKISRGKRTSAFSLHVTNEKGKENFLNTKFHFVLSKKNNELEFQKNKIAQYGILEYEFELYTKSSLFSITDNNLRKELEDIFAKEKCSNIFGSLLYDSAKNFSFYYSPDIDFSSIPKKYNYINSAYDPKVKTEKENVSEQQFTEILSALQKKLFFGIVLNVISAKAIKFFSAHTERDEYIQKAMNAVFSKSLVSAGDMNIEKILGITYGIENFSDILKSDFPLQELKNKYLNGDIVFSEGLGETVASLSTGSLLFANFNAKNSETIDAVLNKSFNYLEQLSIPSFREILDSTIPHSKHSLSASATETVKEENELFYHASIKAAFESKHVYGSPAFCQAKGMLSFAKIKNEQDIEKNLLMSIEQSTFVVLIDSGNEEKNEKILESLARSMQIEEKRMLPYFMKDGSISILIKDAGNLHQGSLMSFEQDFLSSKNLQKYFSQKEKQQNNIYEFLLDKISDRKEKRFFTFVTDVAQDSFRGITSKGLSGFLNNINKKIVEYQKFVPREEEILNASSKINNTSMSFFSSMDRIGKKDKIFPDIINSGAKERMSLEDISTSLFHISRWLMIPEYHHIIKEQLQKNGFVVPEIQPYKFSLSDPSKNILNEDKKKSIISTKSHAGILNFQMLPTIIEIESEDDIKKFINYSARTLLSPFKSDLTDMEYAKNIAEVENQLKTSSLETLKKSKYIFTKLVSIFQDGLVKKQEKLVAVDENLQETVSFNIPVFDFFNELKSDGLIKIENKTKNASFGEKDIDLIFGGIGKYIKAIEKKHISLFEKVDKMFLSSIEKTVNNSEKFNFSIPNKILLAKSIIKNNGDFLTKDMFEKKEIAVHKKINNIFSDDEDEVKNSIIEFYNTNFKGKEYYLLDTDKELKIRKIFFDRFGHRDNKVKDAYGAILEKVAETGRILNSDIKIITLRAFSVYIQRKFSEGKLDVSSQNALINDFLYKILGLEPHQVLEVKGFIALHLRENVNVELLFWEARTKKTRTMIAILLLVSIIIKKPSVFFLQNKNYDDIVWQAFEMLPFIVTDTATLLGTSIKYKAEKASLPVVLSDFIIPNFVSSLKRDNLLKNPTELSMSAANILALKYTNDFYKIYNIVRHNPIGMLKATIDENQEDYPELNFFGELIETEYSDTLKSIISASYSYVVKLFLEGYLKNSDIDKISAVVEKKMNMFLQEYNSSMNVSNINEDNPAKIIFAGKQFVDTFVALEVEDKAIKSENKNKDTIYTQLDVKVNHEVSHEVFKSIPDADIKENILENITLSEDISKMTKMSLAVVFQNSFSKTDDAYLTVINKNLIKALNKAFDKYSETITTKDEKKAFFSSYQIMRKIITTPIMNALKDKEAYFKYIDEDSFLTSSILSNGKPTKVTLLKIDNIIADKIKGTLSGFLYDSEVYDTKEKASDIVLDLFHRQNISNVVAESISLSGTEILVRRVYFKEDSKTNSINKAVKDLLPLASGQHLDKISVEFNFLKTLQGFLGLSKKTEYGFEQFPLVLETESVNSGNPAYFTKSGVIPTKIVISQENGGKTRLELLEAIDKINELPVSIAKNDTKKLSSGYLWELQEKEIGAISIDEAHKNITGNKKITTTSILRKISEIYPKAVQIVSTGTPNKYGEFIEVVSGNIGNKTKRTIDKYCGLYKIDSLFVVSVVETIKTDKEVGDIIDTIIIDAIKSNEGKKYNIDSVAYKYSQILLSTLSANKKVAKTFSALKSIKNENTSPSKSKSLFERILKKALSLKVDLENVKQGQGLDFFEKVLFEPKYGIAKKTAGITNPIGLSEIFNFFINSNLSIKRPAKGVSYNILDKEHVLTFGAKSIPEGTWAPCEKGAALQLTYLYNKKAFNSLAANSVFSMFENIFDIVRDGFLQTCDTRFGLNIQDFNDLVNRSQESVPDGLKDYFSHIIRDGKELFRLSSKQKAIYEQIIENIKYIYYTQVEDILFTVNDGTVQLEDGYEVDVDSEIISELKSSIAGIEDKRYTIGTKEGDKKISLEECGVKVALLDGSEHVYLRDNINIQYEINKELPPVKMRISMLNPDDASIIENMAYSEEAISLAVKHLDSGDNTRHMVTRIALNKSALLVALCAAEQRANKSRALNIVASVSDRGVSEFISTLKNDYSSFLDKNNIKIIETISHNFNDACLPALSKGEQLMVVGNYESLAEGIAMDFIQTGFYMGALNNISSSIQSFARQTGHNQSESNFYLANNGKLSMIDGILEDKSLASMEFHAPFIVNEATSSGQISFVDAKFKQIKQIASFSGHRNAEIMEHFRAYEIIMTGDFNLLKDNRKISHDKASIANIESIVEIKNTKEIELEEEINEIEEETTIKLS